MNINTYNQSPNFQAKFLYSKSLENVVNFAIENHSFDRLNRMQLKIGRAHLKTRLKMDIGTTEAGLPQVTFTRFYPKRDIAIPRTFDDYKEVKKITYTSERRDNPLWFAMHKIIEMGKDAPYNDIFRQVIVEK